jgi:hypothetical protein
MIYNLIARLQLEVARDEGLKVIYHSSRTLGDGITSCLCTFKYNPEYFVECADRAPFLTVQASAAVQQQQQH